MKRNLPFLLSILVCVFFVLSYYTATKEIGRTTWAGGGQMSSLKITPFNYDKYSKEIRELNRLYYLYSEYNEGEISQMHMQKKASYLKLFTYVFSLSGLICIILSVKFFLRYRNTSVQDKYLRKKAGIGDTPERGNFTITTKTNPYGKIISFFTNDKFNPQRVV